VTVGNVALTADIIDEAFKNERRSIKMCWKTVIRGNKLVLTFRFKGKIKLPYYVFYRPKQL